MKKINISVALLMGLMLIGAVASMSLINAVPESVSADTFEIVIPWGLDHPRGKIIKSMIDNSSIANKYNFTYTQVGGGPSDRDALVSRFLAGDYPNLIIITQDWYTEFAEFGIWHDFSTEISAWSGDRAGWRADIPDGWWSILDKVNGDGTGTGIYALPFFGQSVLPYVNLNDLSDAGVTESDLDTLDGFLAAAKKLKDAGKTPYAMVGKLQSDIAYMNYMFASTDNFINSSQDPATVFSWDSAKKYGVNGSLSVEGFAAYLKLKGEGWVPETVDTDGGGEANAIFGAGNASMVLCGPWGTSIFMDAGLAADDFKAIPMPKTSDGVRSTITGGGISMVPIVGQNETMQADAVLLAEWLLEDENQMKTVDNWLNTSWRIPVRLSLKDDPWFTEAGHPERANFVTHIESQDYAFPWGRQHPKWMTIHESVMMPGYRNALLEVEWGKGYTDQWYLDKAQAALDQMAATIQCYYLGGPCVEVEQPTPTASPGFELIYVVFAIGLFAGIQFLRRRR
ncbi:MAG: ABC transporter substrate-binding protein [Candidatus Hodarchaeales archaeon]